MSRGVIFPLLLHTYFSILSADILNIINPADFKNSDTVFWKTSLFTSSDPVSLYDLFTDKSSPSYSPRNGKNFIISNARSEIGENVNDWEFGYFHRIELWIEGSRDFTDLFYTLKRSELLPRNKHYDLALKIDGFQADGLFIRKRYEAYRHNTLSITTGVGINLLRGIRLQEGVLNGYAYAISERDYDFNTAIEYTYSNNYLYARDVVFPNGYGWSSDLGIVVQTPTLIFEALFNDVGGKIYWKDAPYSTALLTSATKHYDEQGYVTYAPSVSGIEQYHRYIQKLPTKMFFGLYSDNRDFNPYLQCSFLNQTPFPEFGGSWIIYTDWTIKVGYETNFSTYSARLHTPIGFISLRADDIRPEKISAFGIEYAITIPFSF